MAVAVFFFEARFVGVCVRVDGTIVIVLMLVLDVVVILGGVRVGMRAVSVLVRVGVRLLVVMDGICAHGTLLVVGTC